MESKQINGFKPEAAVFYCPRFSPINRGKHD